MIAYAEGGTASSTSKTGQNLIARNMKKAGATPRRINAAQKRAAKLPNARVTKV